MMKVQYFFIAVISSEDSDSIAHGEYYAQRQARINDFKKCVSLRFKKSYLAAHLDAKENTIRYMQKFVKSFR